MIAPEIEGLIEAFSKLPGIGKRSATRHVLHLLKHKDSQIAQFVTALKQVSEHVIKCEVCNNLDNSSPCQICQDQKRNNHIICIVEDIADLLAIERSNIYTGKYHILGGVLSAVKGISPDDLNLKSLLNRLEKEEITEIIIATNPTLDGQTTALYIIDLIRNKNIKISKLAHGIPLGSELDYLDEATLDAAFSARSPF